MQCNMLFKSMDNFLARDLNVEKAELMFRKVRIAYSEYTHRRVEMERIFCKDFEII